MTGLDFPPPTIDGCRRARTTGGDPTMIVWAGVAVGAAVAWAVLSIATAHLWARACRNVSKS